MQEQLESVGYACLGAVVGGGLPYLVARMVPEAKAFVTYSALVAHGCCLGGLWNPVYALAHGGSLGMGLIGGAAPLALNMTLPSIFCSLNVATYGVTKLLLLLCRELSSAFRTRKSEVYFESVPWSLGARICTLGVCGGMLVVQMLPSLLQTYYPVASPLQVVDKIAMVGAFVAALLEVLSDFQKTLHKHRNGPSSLVTSGLYKICRHPNYFFEMLFHTCMFFSATSVYSKYWKSGLVMGVFCLCAAGSMFDAAERLEKTQQEVYGKESHPQHAKYLEYIKTTACLIPGAPHLGEHVPKKEDKQN
eukprot:Platyproteum_vivax@DN12434_c0_g1_i1.p1